MLSKIRKPQNFSSLCLISLILLFLLTNPACDRPGGEDEEGNSYTYGLQITSIVDDEDQTPYIVFDLSTENRRTNESAQITVENVVPSDTGTTTPSSGGDSSLLSYDETDSIHLTAYKIDYHIEGFDSIGPYIGRVNVTVPAGGSEKFTIILITGDTKESIVDFLGYDFKKGYLTLTLSGYDGDGNEISRSIDVDAFVYTYLRTTPTLTPSPTYTITPTATVTPTGT